MRGLCRAVRRPRVWRRRGQAPGHADAVDCVGGGYASAGHASDRSDGSLRRHGRREGRVRPRLRGVLFRGSSWCQAGVHRGLSIRSAGAGASLLAGDRSRPSGGLWWRPAAVQGCDRGQARRCYVDRCVRDVPRAVRALVGGRLVSNQPAAKAQRVRAHHDLPRRGQVDGERHRDRAATRAGRLANEPGLQAGDGRDRPRSLPCSPNRAREVRARCGPRWLRRVEPATRQGQCGRASHPGSHPRRRRSPGRGDGRLRCCEKNTPRSRGGAHSSRRDEAAGGQRAGGDARSRERGEVRAERPARAPQPSRRVSSRKSRRGRQARVR